MQTYVEQPETANVWHRLLVLCMFLPAHVVNAQTAQMHEELHTVAAGRAATINMSSSKVLS